MVERTLSGIGFRIVRQDAPGQEPVFEIIYFTKRSSGQDVESSSLAEIVDCLAFDAQKEYIQNAFEELHELIAKAFESGLESRKLEFLFRFDIFRNWHFSADGLDYRRNAMPFEKIVDFGSYLVHRFNLEPIQGASLADVLATTTPHP